MAKIFIDNEILPKAFRKLELSLKLTWYYIWTHCDKSGVWEIDEDLFEFENGFSFDLKSFKENFYDLVEISSKKILVVDFIKVNYGTLTKNYNPHKPVFRDLLKNKVELNPSLNQAYFKLIDEDEEEDKDEKEDKKEEENKKSEKLKIQRKPKAEIQKIEIEYPFFTENFKTQWQLWKVYKSKEFNFKYKSNQSEQASLTELSNLSGKSEKTAIEIINQSMAKGWKGFFELKNNTQNGKQQFSAPTKTAYEFSVDRVIETYSGNSE
ncbi:hypothetical protein QLS91_13080 [Flavobacterium sp. LB2P84]|uniref:hypothetical protein n=1 Tax=Flavobacterium yafengii TaxID=3041253 RepID=UPI0024A81360|nr:hypothetical protein [Flavobacterium yafengii]MDI6034008.1 hypothetical protein [Flavobacterium yafengii]